nr:Ger(x)C family spore germination protein [Neobacillus sp. Marseille-Q6967]
MVRLLFVIICIILLSGCWDKKELNQVAVVVGVGIDKGAQGLYKVTAQVIKPAPEGGKGSGSELPTWSVTGKGKTVMMAIENLNKISPRRLYWAHLQIIIFSESLAREGLAPLLTWFERDRDSRAGSYVVVTKGSAEDLLNQKIELGNISSKAMADILDGSKMRQISARRIKLRDFTAQLLTPGVDSVLDVIDSKKIRGKIETYQLNGVAVFKSDKMVGYIDGSSTMGTEIVFNELNYATIQGTCPNSDNEKFVFLVTDFTNKLIPRVKNNQIEMKMDISLEGNVIDQSCSTDLLEKENIKYIEKEISKNIKIYVQKEFNTAKELQSDIYGIGKEVRRFYPEVWAKRGKNKDYLNDVVFNMKIESNVRRSGLVIEPTQVKIREVEP